MARLAAAAVHLGCIFQVALGRRSTTGGSLRAARASSEAYSFAQFARDFGRSYAGASAEVLRREALFEASLAEVRATNARNEREGRSWRAGVHPFMDWTPEERAVLNGYKPSHAHRGQRPSGAVFSLLHQGASAFAGTSASARLNASFGGSGGMTAEAGPALRNQGNCGSCWAISAVEAVEAQLIRSGSGGVRLAAQALVDCVPNPQHCGGTGGCDGATGELAYSFMRDHGIPLESELPYRARTGTCSQAPSAGAWPARRARVDGWSQLPSNQLEPLKSALVQQGPVVVAVDGNNWFNYDSGVFDDCAKDAILGHAVLAKGFGEDGGKKYWLIQNSWGSEWGENGHIRMLMHDDEEQWCGVDRKPKEGLGCDGGPPEVTVCGMCGILYDPIVPTGVRLESADGAADAGAAAGGDAAGASAGAQMDALLHKFASS